MLVKVYKDGEEQEVWAVDLAGWVACGWSMEKPASLALEGQESVAVATVDELEEAPWQEIKAVCDDLGLTKPEGKTWKEMIPLIREARSR
jgi:hypothetical protein